MHIASVNPYHPGEVTPVQVEKCEVCKALVTAEDYEEHVSSHEVPDEAPQVPEKSQEPPKTKLQTSPRGKTE